MKKTYIAPELFAVELQHQDGILLKDSFELVGPGSGVADVKEFEFVDDDEDDAGTTTGPRSIWDSEW
jgi:hypothetical protein